MPIELAPKVYWVGAIDWTIRDFHGYLTEDGSTYNAYLIVDDHITLIDTVKKEFVPEMMARVAEIVDPAKIDYIVSNHVEMDHSGGLPEVIEQVKPEKVFCSPMGKAGLLRHYKEDWPFVEVKTGSELSTGRYNLTFLETPMLHWPDSMMTYLKEEQILFSSDAFGAHLASSEHFDDRLPAFPLPYARQLKKYYANILMPFGALITQLFAKIAQLGLTFKIIAPDHGLIYRRNIDWVLAAYQKWAAGSRGTQSPGDLRHHVAQHRDAGRGVYPGPDGRRGGGPAAPPAAHPSQRHHHRGPGRRAAPVRLSHPQQPDVPHHGGVFDLSEGFGAQKQGRRRLRVLRLERPGRGPDHQGA